MINVCDLPRTHASLVFMRTLLKDVTTLLDHYLSRDLWKSWQRDAVNVLRFVQYAAMGKTRGYQGGTWARSHHRR